jgi:hypothetical protein
VEEGEGGGSRPAIGRRQRPWPAGAGGAAGVRHGRGGERKGGSGWISLLHGSAREVGSSDRLNEFKPKIQIISNKFKIIQT